MVVLDVSDLPEDFPPPTSEAGDEALCSLVGFGYLAIDKVPDEGEEHGRGEGNGDLGVGQGLPK